MGWYFSDRDEPIANTVERMADLPMAGQPGEGFVYGYATDILGVVIERASGLGFGITKEIGWSGLPGSPGAYNWGGAYHSMYWVDPAEELVVSYMTQVIPAQGLDDHQRIRALVYQALVD